MNTQWAFLLRFQEFCNEKVIRGLFCGTATHTKVSSEQPDTDMQSDERLIFPKSLNSISSELDENDSERKKMHSSQFEALIKLSSTSTITTIKAEGSDSDPSLKQYVTFPRC